MDPPLTIPVLDLADYNIHTAGVSADRQRELADELHAAFSTVGFVYVKNHGIPEEEVSTAFSAGRAFFALPPSNKQRYGRGRHTNNHGWLSVETERFDDRLPDYKESFDACPSVAGGPRYPDGEVPALRPATETFHARCRALATRLLTLMETGLGLEPGYFTDRHDPQRFSYTAVRYLYYPAVERDLKAGQLRCGEHTDYGTMTLLFQDTAGGLEVFDRRSARYVPAPPLPGCVVVNVGDLTERWSGRRLRSTLHRVVPAPSGRERQAVVCFVHPDADTVISPPQTEGGDTAEDLPPITAGDFIAQRFAETLIETEGAGEKTNGGHGEDGHGVDTARSGGR